MKKYVLVFLIVMLGAGLLFSEPELKLDIKTKFKEKYELKGIKWGVIYFLKQDGYKIVEVREDYAVWLMDIEEKQQEPNKYILKLTVNISPPSLFRRKDPVASGNVEVNYTFSPKQLNVDDTGFIDFIKEKVDNIEKKEKLRAFLVGRETAKQVKLLLMSLKKKRTIKDI